MERGALISKLLTLIVVGLLAATAVAEPVHFAFNPPDSITFHSRMVSERYRVLNEQKSPIDSSFITTREVLRRTDDGYVITMDAEQFETSRAGQALSNPVLDAFEAVDVTLHLDPVGKALSVTGFENIMPYIASRTDSATAADVAQMLDPSVLALRQVDEWNSRIGRLTGLSMNSSQRGFDRGEYPLPDGGILDLFTSFRVVDTSRMKNRLTLRVTIESNSDPSKLAEVTGLDTTAVAEAFGLTPDAVTALGKLQVRSTTHIELVVDASTLLVRQEASMSTISLSVNDPQAGPQHLEIIDRRTIDYTYTGWE
jgi:hypothetical protein